MELISTFKDYFLSHEAHRAFSVQVILFACLGQVEHVSLYLQCGANEREACRLPMEAGLSHCGLSGSLGIFSVSWLSESVEYLCHQ